MQEIDFVVPWVDGNDPVWKKKYASYKGEELVLEGEQGARYRENDIFKYWFRAVEKYAPWVRKIHLITDNQTPNWLNINHPKLNLVNHTDYIPSKYLPAFNANVIELNMHRIEGLSDKFVYFNDDFFLNGPIDSEFYFIKGLPCDSLILKPLAPCNVESIQFVSMMVMNTVLINKNFSLRKLVRNNPNKLFPLCYSSKMVKNYFYYKFNKFFIGFDNPHLPQPFIKSTFNEVWEKEGEYLNATCKNKFRASSDLTQYLFRYWQLASAKFHPISPKHMGIYYNICNTNVSRIIKTLKNESYKQICLNDSIHFDDDRALEQIREALDEKFQYKSTYEI